MKFTVVDNKHIINNKPIKKVVINSMDKIIDSNQLTAIKNYNSQVVTIEYNDQEGNHLLTTTANNVTIYCAS